MLVYALFVLSSFGFQIAGWYHLFNGDLAMAFPLFIYSFALGLISLFYRPKNRRHS
jgi:NADH:ubiquinone oxidoreductase subunit 6 (subunit J)